MKVVKRGRLPEDRVVQWACRRCNSVIEAKKSEGQVRHDQRDGDYVIFSCPVCGEKNYIEAKRFGVG